MKIAVKPAVTSRAAGTRPSSSRFRALNTVEQVSGWGRATRQERQSSARGVERGVDQRVGRLVLGARDRADRPALERTQRGKRLGVQRTHVGVLDLVDAG